MYMTNIAAVHIYMHAAYFSIQYKNITLIRKLQLMALLG